MFVGGSKKGYASKPQMGRMGTQPLGAKGALENEFDNKMSMQPSASGMRKNTYGVDSKGLGGSSGMQPLGAYKQSSVPASDHVKVADLVGGGGQPKMQRPNYREQQPAVTNDDRNWMSQLNQNTAGSG